MALGCGEREKSVREKRKGQRRWVCLDDGGEKRSCDGGGVGFLVRERGWNLEREEEGG